MTDQALKAAVERLTALADHYNRRAVIMGRFADQCAASDDYKPVADADADHEHQVAADLRTLLAALSVMEEMAGLLSQVAGDGPLDFMIGGNPNAIEDFNASVTDTLAQYRTLGGE